MLHECHYWCHILLWFTKKNYTIHPLTSMLSQRNTCCRWVLPPRAVEPFSSFLLLTLFPVMLRSGDFQLCWCNVTCMQSSRIAWISSIQARRKLCWEQREDNFSSVRHMVLNCHAFCWWESSCRSSSVISTLCLQTTWQIVKTNFGSHFLSHTLSVKRVSVGEVSFRWYLPLTKTWMMLSEFKYAVGGR